MNQVLIQILDSLHVHRDFISGLPRKEQLLQLQSSLLLFFYLLSYHLFGLFTVHILSNLHLLCYVRHLLYFFFLLSLANLSHVATFISDYSCLWMIWCVSYVPRFCQSRLHCVLGRYSLKLGGESNTCPFALSLCCTNCLALCFHFCSFSPSLLPVSLLANSFVVVITLSEQSIDCHRFSFFNSVFFFVVVVPLLLFLFLLFLLFLFLLFLLFLFLGFIPFSTTLSSCWQPSPIGNWCVMSSPMSSSNVIAEKDEWMWGWMMEDKLTTQEKISKKQEKMGERKQNWNMSSWSPFTAINLSADWEAESRLITAHTHTYLVPLLCFFILLILSLFLSSFFGIFSLGLLVFLWSVLDPLVYAEIRTITGTGGDGTSFEGLIVPLCRSRSGTIFAFVIFCALQLTPVVWIARYSADRGRREDHGKCVRSKWMRSWDKPKRKQNSKTQHLSYDSLWLLWWWWWCLFGLCICCFFFMCSLSAFTLRMSLAIFRRSSTVGYVHASTFAPSY